MADIIPPGFAEVTIPIRHTGLTRSAAVVFGIERVSVANTPEDQCDVLQSLFMTSIGARCDSQCTLGPTQMRVGQDGGEALAASGSVTNPGARSTDTVTPNVAALLHKRSARGGRRGRGRMYMPWYFAEADVDEVGNVLPALVTSSNVLYADFLADLTTAGLPMVILHSAGLTVPGDPDTVTSLTLDNRAATQRRRLR